MCRGKGECEDKAMWRSAEVSWRGAVAWDFVFSHRRQKDYRKGENESKVGVVEISLPVQ